MAKNSILLKEVPSDVRAIILKEQSEHQIKCSCRFSKENTIKLILRKWAKIKDYRVNNVPISKMVDEM